MIRWLAIAGLVLLASPSGAAGPTTPDYVRQWQGPTGADTQVSCTNASSTSLASWDGDRIAICFLNSGTVDVTVCSGPNQGGSSPTPTPITCTVGIGGILLKANGGAFCETVSAKTGFTCRTASSSATVYVKVSK